MTNATSKLIDDLGGRVALAERVKKRVGTIDVWRHRGHIPRDAWPEIQKAFPSVTLDQLLETEDADEAAPDAAAANAGAPSGGGLP